MVPFSVVRCLLDYLPDISGTLFEICIRFHPKRERNVVLRFTPGALFSRLLGGVSTNRALALQSPTYNAGLVPLSAARYKVTEIVLQALAAFSFRFDT